MPFDHASYMREYRARKAKTKSPVDRVKDYRHMSDDDVLVAVIERGKVLNKMMMEPISMWHPDWTKD